MVAPEIYNMLNQWAASVVAQAKLNLITKKKNATKDLYNSITYKVMPDGEIEFFYADQGDFVESGRRKGARLPPPTKLAQWAKIKGLKQFRDKKGKFISNEARGWMIAYGIKKNGIKKFPFFSSALDGAMNDYYYKLQEAIAEAITNDFEDMYSE